MRSEQTQCVKQAQTQAVHTGLRLRLVQFDLPSTGRCFYCEINMDEEVALLALGFLTIRRRRRRRRMRDQRQHRRIWVRDIYKHREERGAYHTLVQELQLGDRELYFK